MLLVLSIRETELLPDLARRLRIYLARRNGSQFVADEYHHVAALGAPSLRPE
jgi:hypothetical protein